MYRARLLFKRREIKLYFPLRGRTHRITVYINSWALTIHFCGNRLQSNHFVSNCCDSCDHNVDLIFVRKQKSV